MLKRGYRGQVLQHPTRDNYSQLQGKRKFLRERMAKREEEIMVSAQWLAWILIARKVMLLRNEIPGKNANTSNLTGTCLRQSASLLSVAAGSIA